MPSQNDWLVSLRLSAEPSINDSQGGLGLPQWASFFVWYGWWLRTNINAERRLIALTVSPTRSFCSSFAALGALIAGAQLYEDKLTWQEICDLPIGTKIFYRVPNTRVRGGRSQEQGVFRGLSEHDGEHFIVIEPQTRRKGTQVTLSLSFNISKFREYTFTTEQPPTRTQSALYESNAKWFEGLVPAFDKNWLWSEGAECLVVSNKVQFTQEISALSLSISGQKPHDLSALLSMSTTHSGESGKMLLSSGKSNLSILHDCPIAILDGIASLRSRDHVRATNLLIALERAEYLDEANNLALELNNVRDDALLPHGAETATPLPNGIEATVFAISSA